MPARQRVLYLALSATAAAADTGPAAPNVRALAKEYISWDTNTETKAVVQDLLDAGDDASLRPMMTKHLEFGTAGLRGPMAAGYRGLNELTIVQATQGLAAYL